MPESTKPKVKICGITRSRDARLAGALGAWSVGVIFVPNTPRYLDPIKARTIIRSIPHQVLKVGVFRNQCVEEMAEIGAYAGLDLYQLHGSESIDTCDQLGMHRVIKVMPWPAAQDVESIIEHPAAFVLFDKPKSPQTVAAPPDFNAARRVVENRSGVLLAGGLRPENVAPMISRIQPFGIDVAGGVESSPGIKDAARMRALFQSIDSPPPTTGSGDFDCHPHAHKKPMETST